MNIDGASGSQDMQRLRYDVLKQAEASLSSFIGTVDYSDSFSHSAAVQGAVAGGVVLASEPEPETQPNQPKDLNDTMFAGPGLISATEHANEMTARYGTLEIARLCSERHFSSVVDNNASRCVCAGCWNRSQDPVD